MTNNKLNSNVPAKTVSPAEQTLSPTEISEVTAGMAKVSASTSKRAGGR